MSALERRRQKDCCEFKVSPLGLHSEIQVSLGYRIKTCLRMEEKEEEEKWEEEKEEAKEE